jgi:lysozyme
MALNTSAAAAAVCAGASTVEGIDVSSFDGTIDWTAVAASKGFAFARMSDGTGFVDPTFSENYLGIRAAGMARGAYQLFEPAQDPVAQAELLLQNISVPLQPGDLPPALDVEITGGQSAATIATNVQTWATTVQNAIGKPPIIFASAVFWNNDVQSSALANNPLWVVQWNVSCPTLPSAWSSWLFWMHADDGSVDGVSGQVDLDTFNGSALQLQALIENDRLFANGFELP